MSEDTPEIGWPASLPAPQHVEIRAQQMLGIMRQGLADMSDPELNVRRITLGFFGVVVFGRAVTSGLQKLRHFDRRAFAEWYRPWFDEMKADPLCRFF